MDTIITFYIFINTISHFASEEKGKYIKIIKIFGNKKQTDRMQWGNYWQ